MSDEENLPDISNLIERKEDEECQCDYCKGHKRGFDEGVDANWDWVRAGLLKMIDKKELQDTNFIPKLQKVIGDMSLEEFESIIKDIYRGKR